MVISTITVMTEVNSFYEINGWKVYYEKIGSGPNPILLIPGAVGTGRTDFPELLEGEDELDFEKFTVIAVEAPGWGRSRSSARKYGVNVYNNDCECFHGVMKHLGYDKYSIIGFSEGARIALLMAIKYKQSILALVLSAFRLYPSIKGVTTLSVNKWGKEKLKEYLKIYENENEIQKLWNRFLKFVEFYVQYFPEDIYKGEYKSVGCPVLITHGDKDEFVELEQPFVLSKRLSNVRLHRFPLGEHESHQKYAAQYTKLVQEHILEKNNNFNNDTDLVAQNSLDQIMSNNILI